MDIMPRISLYKCCSKLAAVCPKRIERAISSDQIDDNINNLSAIDANLIGKVSQDEKINKTYYFF